MTMMEFFGCGFIAFGAPLAMFVFTIARDPLRIIVFVASAFFWLLSLLLSAGWWKAVVPLREVIAFGLVFSVIFQEVFRLLFYLLLKKAEEGLLKVWQVEAGSGTMSLVANKSLMAYVAGFGYGVISGAFSLVNVLADMTGPGTVGIHGQSQHFFITSAFLTLCFILLHTFWGILYFDGFHRQRYYQPAAVLISHLLVSGLTLFNQRDDPVYEANLIPAYIVLVIMAVWSFLVVGGSLRNIKACVFTQQSGYNL